MPGESAIEVMIAGLFKADGKLLLYQQPRRCVLCGNLRMLHVEQEGAKLCFLCFEAMGFDLRAGTSEAKP